MFQNFFERALDEGIIYRHPECTETATVWGESEEAVADVLTTTTGGNEAT